MVIILVLIILVLIYNIFTFKENYSTEIVTKYDDYWDGNLKNVNELNINRDIKFNITPFRTIDSFEEFKKKFFDRYEYNLESTEIDNIKIKDNLGYPKLGFLTVLKNEIATYDFHEFLKKITLNHNKKNVINTKLYDVKSNNIKYVDTIFSNKVYNYQTKDNQKVTIDFEDLLLLHFEKKKIEKNANYNFVKDQIISLLNENLSKQYNENNEKLSFLISKDRIINYKKNEYDNKEYFDFIVKLYSNNNSDTIMFQIQTVYDPESMKILILFLRYLGKEIQSDHFFSYLLESNYNDGDENNIHCSFSDSKKCIIKGNKKKDLYIRNKYYCFDTDENVDFNIDKSNIDNKEDCEGIDGKNGIWDKICETNEECPFYKKNKNYSNEFGRCQSTGYCEFPLNMRSRSYTKPSLTKPLCHNCKPIYKNYNDPQDSKNYYKPNDNLEKCKDLDCHTCCEDQKDKNLYPELNGPDYAFHDDFITRNHNKRELKNLKTTF